MSVKIIITIQCGNVIAVSATQDIKYVVVDYDLLDVGKEPVSDVLEADYVNHDLSGAYSLNDPDDKEICEELKRIHF